MFDSATAAYNATFLAAAALGFLMLLVGCVCFTIVLLAAGAIRLIAAFLMAAAARLPGREPGA